MKLFLATLLALFLFAPALQAHEAKGFEKINSKNTAMHLKITAIGSEFIKEAMKMSFGKGDKIEKVEMSFGHVYFGKKQSNGCRQFQVFVTQKLGSVKPFHWHGQVCRSGGEIQVIKL